MEATTTVGTTANSTTTTSAPGASTIPSSTANAVNVTPSPGQGSGATASAPDWASSFNDDTKGYIQNKGFKSPEDVLNSYRNFEKLQGVPQDRILKLPENMDSPEARAVWEKLGAPKEAKDYNLAIPAEGGDPTLAQDMAKNFHEIGVPKTMAEKITAKWNERQAAVQAAGLENQKMVAQAADQALRKEWGQAYEQNLNVVNSAARTLGIDNNQTAALGKALGPDNAMKLLFKLGSATGEHTFVNGQGANQVFTPEAAQSKIRELQTNQEWASKYLNGDKAAFNQMQSLQQMANPGESGL